MITMTKVLAALDDAEAVAAAIGIPTARWANDCHAVSLAAVRSGILGEPGPRVRVARGTWRAPSPDIAVGQHSWIVLCPEPRFGDDMPGAYRPDAIIVDLTLGFTIADKLQEQTGRPVAQAPGIVADVAGKLDRYRPHGAGDIWGPEGGRALRGKGKRVWLTPERPFSSIARVFLEVLGPLDRSGWSTVFHGPMCGWPSAEIITGAAQTEEVAALIPIDIQGMVTDLNPSRLYW